MTKSTIKSTLLLTTAAAMIAGMVGTAPAYAQDSEQAVNDEIITIGTRRAARSAADTPAPVDVISGAEFNNQGAQDIGDLLRTSVPSYNVNTQPISDAATIIRPANLRGLSPDNTLILLNGKRRHRGSVISFLGGGIADGAQGVDVSVFPTLGLKQVEVLRDGASSQYGSDAIAGVINFGLKDADSGGVVSAEYGSTYEGDGEFYKIGGNIGMPLGDGFLNLTGEYGERDGTVRSVVRTDVQNLIAAGNTAVADFQTINSYTDEVPQYWGSPDVTDELKLFFNAGIPLSDNAELYAFGNYAERTVEGGFFYRNPTNRGGVYRGPLVDPLTGLADPNGVPSVRVGDLDGVGTGGTCIDGIPLTGTNGLITDPAFQAIVNADANCFAFNEPVANGGIPSGFVPRFGGNNEDSSIAVGVRGDWALGNGLGYDFSFVSGTSTTDFFIKNTINASLGPNTPRDFVPGAYEQEETGVRADFVYAVPVNGWASDLSIAFGAEWREETFTITAGDPASFALGPLAAQGFSSSSNGFGGFSSDLKESQDNIGVYTELEADITDKLTLQGAVRFEDYSSFGDTTNWKIAGLYRVTDNFTLRSTYSTGFHAPTAGQANVTNITTQNVGGQLIDQGTIPLTTSPGQLAADFLESSTGVRPTLGTEEATNFSIGAAFDTGVFSWTIDFFNIDVQDRIATTDTFAFIDVLRFADVNNVIPAGASVGDALTALDADGQINRADFTGFEDLTSFRFFANNFDTETSGIDIVGRAPLDFGRGDTDLTLALNYTKTEVTDRGTIAPISDTRVRALEDLLPEWKGNATITHTEGPWRGLVRVNYFGEWFDTGNGFDVGSEWVVDAEIGYNVTEELELIAGAFNIFDQYPDETPNPGGLGQLYPEASPMGFNGGTYYVKARYTFE